MEAVERLVDEKLEALAAARQGIVVSDDDVDNALAEIALRERMTVARLLHEASATGITAPYYRAVVRVQLLERRRVLQDPPRVISQVALVSMLRSRAQVEILR